MKNFIATIFVVSPLFLLAQLDIQLGGVAGLSSSKTFDEFRDYYNSINQTGVAQPMDKGSFNYGTNIQVGLKIMNYYSAIGYCNVYNSPKVVFENGAQRVIYFNSRYFNILMGYINDDSDVSEFGIYSGFVVNDYIMSSYIRYKNKDKDYTAGAISGNFQTQGFGIPLIGHYSHRIIDPVWIYAKCQLQVLSATKFGIYDYLNLSKQIKDDSRKILFEVGVQFKIQ